METVGAYAESAPLRGHQFDLVISRLAPRHFDEVEREVAEMVRLTKIDGRVAIIDLEGHETLLFTSLTTSWLLHDPTHVRSYMATRWRSIFESSGMKVEVLKDRLWEQPQGLTVRR